MEAASDVPCRSHGPHRCCWNKEEHSLKTWFNTCRRTVSWPAQVFLKLRLDSISPLVLLSRAGRKASWCSVHFLHNCVQHMWRRSTHVDCCDLLNTDLQESSHTCPRSHCSCTSHGIVLNASRTLDGQGRKNMFFRGRRALQFLQKPDP